jgi:hypothetical protein
MVCKPCRDLGLTLTSKKWVAVPTRYGVHTRRVLVVEHVSQTRRSSGSAGLSKLRRRLPTENIYGVVTGAPSVMPTWLGTNLLETSSALL